MTRTTRQQILEHLERHGSMSAGEIAHLMQLTAADVRHHLKALRHEGVVSLVATRSQATGKVEATSPGRGRPIQFFGLSSQVERHNLNGLASALLRQYVGGLPAEARTAAMQAVAGELAGAGGPSPVSLTRRLTTAVQRLNELGYRARWEAHASAPRLVLGHCPYAAIIAGHPELCQMDAALLEKLAQAPTRQTEKLAPNAQGVLHCLFLVGAPS